MEREGPSLNAYNICHFLVRELEYMARKVTPLICLLASVTKQMSIHLFFDTFDIIMNL